MKSTGNFSRTCRSCLVLLQQLPFANSSLNSSSNSEPESMTEEQNIKSMWTELEDVVQKYRLRLKLGHVNANSIEGFRFYEIRTWQLSGRFDFLVISETKIDGSFPDSQFQVKGFRLCRNDRKAGGGGLMIYVRSDIHFVKVKHLKGITPEERAAFRTETLILKVKLNRSWIAVVGVYRPPSIPKHHWTRELSSIFEEVSTLTETVFYAGVLNADLLNPDKPPKDGRNLLDLMEIFGLDCLITKATRKTRTSDTPLGLILTNDKKKTLASDVVDTQTSDHSLVFTILRLRAPRSRSRKICARSFNNFKKDNFIQDLQMVPFSIVDMTNSTPLNNCTTKF